MLNVQSVKYTGILTIVRIWFLLKQISSMSSWIEAVAWYVT